MDGAGQPSGLRLKRLFTASQFGKQRWAAEAGTWASPRPHPATLLFSEQEELGFLELVSKTRVTHHAPPRS